MNFSNIFNGIYNCHVHHIIFPRQFLFLSKIQNQWAVHQVQIFDNINLLKKKNGLQNIECLSIKMFWLFQTGCWRTQNTCLAFFITYKFIMYVCL